MPSVENESYCVLFHTSAITTEFNSKSHETKWKVWQITILHMFNKCDIRTKVVVATPMCFLKQYSYGQCQTWATIVWVGVCLGIAFVVVRYVSCQISTPIKYDWLHRKLSRRIETKGANVFAQYSEIVIFFFFMCNSMKSIWKLNHKSLRLDQLHFF